MDKRVLWLVVLGLGLRGFHYGRDPAVWHDEAALLLNVLHHSFAELLGPLYYSEAAPPLFLWIEKLVALGLGDGTYALRLVPWLASCGALVGLLLIGRRLLPTSSGALLGLVVLVGCSDRLLWHCCEAKPYAVDVLVATGLLATLVWPLASLRRQLLLYACLSPFLIFLSFPACFLLGAIALCWLPAVWRSGESRVWWTYGLFLTLLGGAFAALLFGPIHAQRDPRLLECWQDMFPDWQHPWSVPGTALQRLTEVFRYACEPIGNVLALLAIPGGVTLWRAGQRRVLAFLVLPLLLTALAWLAGQYPFGPSRVMVFAAPACLLLIAAGLPGLGAWPGRCGQTLALLPAGLLLFPVVQAAYRCSLPWSRPDAGAAASFVRQQRQADELVLGTDWEHTYYFRDARVLYRPLTSSPMDLPTPPALNGDFTDVGERFWLLATGTAVERRKALQTAEQGVGCWILLQREFTGVTAYWLARNRCATDARDASATPSDDP